MLLVIEIAAGIVLAYAIIQNRTVLLRWSKNAGIFLLWAALAGVAVYGIATGMDSAASSVSRFVNIRKALSYLVIPVFFAAAAFGGLGLYLLVGSFWKGLGDRRRDAMMLGMSFLNAILVTVASIPLFWFPGYVAFFNGIDFWSRSHGFADAGTMLLFSLALPWPWIPVWFLLRGRAREQSAELQLEQ